MIVPRIWSGMKHSPHRFALLQLAIILLLTNLFLASCSFPFGGSSGTTSSVKSSELAIAIAQLQWCGKPSMIFRDEGAVVTPTTTATPTPAVTPTTTVNATPTATVTTTATNTPTTTVTAGPGTPGTVTDWSEVNASLGFTVFLPSKLPANTCLVNAQATIHDPIIGGSFTIGYLLPDHSAFTLSEAPLFSQNTAFQCNPSNGATPQANATPKVGTPTPSPRATQETPVLLCSGVKDTTNIVMSARGSIDHLQQVFTELQPNIPWIPAS